MLDSMTSQTPPCPPQFRSAMHPRSLWAPITVMAAAVLSPGLQQRGEQCFVAQGVYVWHAWGRSWEPSAEAHDTVTWKSAAGLCLPGGPAEPSAPCY